MNNAVKIVFISIFCTLFLVFPRISSAQTPTLNPATILGGSDSVATDFFDRIQTNTLGLGCGLPQSENRMDNTTKCCSANLNSDEIQKSAINSIPEYFCLPEALSRAAGGIGGILSGAIGQVTDSVGAVIDLAHGDVSGALGNLTDLPSTLLDPVKGVLNSKKVCLSDAGKLLTASTLSMLPYQNVQKLPLPSQPCVEGAVPSTNDYSSASCKCVSAPDPGVVTLCNRYVRSPSENAQCLACATHGYWTGLGCISSNLSGFVGSIMTLGLGIAGGAAFLCILYAAFVLQSSRGNPEKVKKAREYLNTCLIGLGIIIFSIFILRIIGVDILRIPGLS